MDSIISHSAAETLAAARAFSERLAGGEVIALQGDLGAGKTHFVKGLAEGLQFAGPVTSPTFSLVHEYRGGRLTIFHFDWYRLETAQEAIDFGLEEYLEEPGAVSVVEWADRFPHLVEPDFSIAILNRGGDVREIVIER